MSDQGTRELERRWRESGDPGALGALLTAQMRQGVLESRKVAAAALWGSQAARIAYPDVPKNLQPDLPLWYGASHLWGEELLRVALCVTRGVGKGEIWHRIEQWAIERADRPRQIPVEFVRQAWIAQAMSGTQTNDLITWHMVMLADKTLPGGRDRSLEDQPAEFQRLSPIGRYGPPADRDEDGVWDIFQGLLQATFQRGRPRRWETILADLDREVTPWLLGLHDPVAEQHTRGADVIAGHHLAFMRGGEWAFTACGLTRGICERYGQSDGIRVFSNPEMGDRYSDHPWCRPCRIEWDKKEQLRA